MAPLQERINELAKRADAISTSDVNKLKRQFNKYRDVGRDRSVAPRVGWSPAPLISSAPGSVPGLSHLSHLSHLAGRCATRASASAADGRGGWVARAWRFFGGRDPPAGDPSGREGGSSQSIDRPSRRDARRPAAPDDRARGGRAPRPHVCAFSRRALVVRGPQVWAKRRRQCNELVEVMRSSPSPSPSPSPSRRCRAPESYISSSTTVVARTDQSFEASGRCDSPPFGASELGSEPTRGAPCSEPSRTLHCGHPSYSVVVCSGYGLCCRLSVLSVRAGGGREVLADGMDKKPKDVRTLVDIETDEMAKAPLPVALVVK